MVLSIILRFIFLIFLILWGICFWSSAFIMFLFPFLYPYQIPFSLIVFSFVHFLIVRLFYFLSSVQRNIIVQVPVLYFELRFALYFFHFSSNCLYFLKSFNIPILRLPCCNNFAVFLSVNRFRLYFLPLFSLPNLCLVSFLDVLS